MYDIWHEIGMKFNDIIGDIIGDIINDDINFDDIWHEIYDIWDEIDDILMIFGMKFWW